MSSEQSLDMFITRMARNIAVLYPNNCADEEDYIQTGHLKLAEISNGGYEERDFRAYAIIAIARAMREVALGAMGAAYAPEKIKRLIHKVELLIYDGKTEQEIRNELKIDAKTLSSFKSLITSESWHRLFNEPACEQEQFSVIDDLLSSGCFAEEEKIFLRAHFEDDVNSLGMTRRQRWSLARSLRPKVTRSGYGI